MKFNWYRCECCQHDRPFERVLPKVNVDGPGVILFAPLIIVLGLLRHSVFPDRCVVCFQPLLSVFQKRRPESYPQPKKEMNLRLSPFRKRVTDYFDVNTYRTYGEDIHKTRTLDRHYSEHLLEHGFPVGGDKESILHVAHAQPRAFYAGYERRLFYLLFTPVTFWFYRHRLSEDPSVYYLPPLYEHAGRVVVTNQRLFICDVKDSAYCYHSSLPYAAIKEVRQSGPDLKVQPNDPDIATVRIHIGREIGELLKAIHHFTPIRVRDPRKDWEEK